MIQGTQTRLPTRPPAIRPGVRGLARVDRRTKNLIPRLKPGEIAILDHRDLDGLCASAIVERRPAAVVNASASISGRYPNRGPTILLKAGIPLLDLAQSKVMEELQEGQTVELDDNGLRCGDRLYPGVWLDLDEVELALSEARSFLGGEIEAFARNTLQYIERERHLVLDNLEIPDLRTSLAGRHAVVVVRGEGYKLDLEAILPYIREVRPVLIAVDGGADALLEYDLKPDLIVGDMDSVSDQALRCGAEIVVHAYPSQQSGGAGGNRAGSNGVGDISELGAAKAGTAGLGAAGIGKVASPGIARLQALKMEARVFSVAGTSEDMAMLIAYEKGAELIVAVGTHFSLVDFLDKGRSGMASTFLVRLRVGSRLVDARGVGALYQTGPGLGYAGYLVAAAAVPVAALAMLSPGLRAFLSLGYTLFTHWLRRHGW